jgi:hypothetical protein
MDAGPETLSDEGSFVFRMMDCLLGQEAGLTIPRRMPSRMPSGPTAQIVAAREEMNM